MIIYGKQVCLHALTRYESSVKTVYIAKKGILPQKLYDKYKLRIKFLENKWAMSMAKGGNHQGILIEMEEFVPSDLTTMKENNFVLILDSLTDVGNIGAIVRTAYALGVDGIIVSGIKQLNFSAIARSSSGALLDMPFVIIPNILDVINELKQIEFKIYGASMDGVAINSCKFSGKRVLILGSEGEGISKRAKGRIDKMVSIDMQREFDSLNVSAAAAILIDRMRYEVK
jgi:23S rRNA (guanosine2251-2'-O)-methyltransferase